MQKILIHPMVVHFPIAFYFLELALIGMWIAKKDPFYGRASFLSFRLGYVLMLAAMAAGLWDVGGPANVRGAVRVHVISALTLFAVYTARAVYYRMVRKDPKEHRGVKLAGAVLGIAAVISTGWLGSLLLSD